jgi:hypothetical protein
VASAPAAFDYRDTSKMGSSGPHACVQHESSLVGQSQSRGGEGTREGSDVQRPAVEVFTVIPLTVRFLLEWATSNGTPGDTDRWQQGAWRPDRAGSSRSVIWPIDALLGGIPCKA